MSSYKGDFTPGKTIRFKFPTHKADGTPITLSGTPALSVYKGGSTTESTSGVTLTVDYDSRTGCNDVVIDTSADGTFYAAANDFEVVISAGTVDSISVVGTPVGSFSLSNRSALRPTTADRTLVVDGAGLADSNVVKVGPSGSGAAQTARDIGGDSATLVGRLTAARAGYLDNLNVGGPVASQADVLAINLSATKHLLLQSVPQYERPESGSTLYTIECRTFDAESGDPVNADSTPTLTATGGVSGDLSANLSAATNPETGVYRWTYTVAAAATVEPIIFGVSATIATVARTLAFFSQIVDDVAATFTETDKSHLTALFNKAPAGNIADEALLLAAIGSPMQADDANVAAIKAQTDKLTFSGSNLFSMVEAYAAGQDPWSQIKGQALSATPTLNTVEAKLQLIGADEYTDEATDPTQWRTVYVVAGSGAPGTGYALATKKLWDTGGAKVTANNQVIGQAST